MGDLGMADYVWDPTPHDNIGGGSITWVIWAWLTTSGTPLHMTTLVVVA